MGGGEDATDVAAVLAGNVDQFEGIVRRWEHRLVNLGWRFFHDEALANEATQEAFVLCFRRLGQWRGDASFGTWLYGLALNVCRSKLRTLRRRPTMLPLASAAHTASPDQLDRAQVRRRVRQEIARLPDKYREALVVYYLEEQDLTTAAERLGVPTGTLKARLHRARELLRPRLAKILP